MSPRTRAPDRLREIVDAALDVFMRSGYRRARMADVARAAGVSPGLLYTYAETKEALFNLVLQRELGVDVDALPLPVPTPDPAATRKLVGQALWEVGTIPTLDAAGDAPADVGAELAAIVGEFYDRVHRYRRFIRLLERSALEWPELADRFYERGRRPFVSRLGEYIRGRVGTGHFRPVPDPDVAARFVIETVSWFANHRYGDHDGARIDDGTARATVVQLVSAGLVGSRRRR
jgi:AcrR family transcriptional regulator